MPRAGFPPAARLRQSGEFRRVFADGHKFVSPGFVMIVARRSEGEARLGLALAKRRIAKANQRNRVKRVLRESFRLRRAELGSQDVVVLARSRTGAMTNANLFAQLDTLWTRIARASSGPDPSGSGESPPR